MEAGDFIRTLMGKTIITAKTIKMPDESLSDHCFDNLEWNKDHRGRWWRFDFGTRKWHIIIYADEDSDEQ